MWYEESFTKVVLMESNSDSDKDVSFDHVAISRHELILSFTSISPIIVLV